MYKKLTLWVLVATIFMSTSSVSYASENLLDRNELLELMTGYVDYTVDYEGYLDVETFTKEQKEYWGAISNYLGSFVAQEQTMISFVTDSDEFGFDYKSEVTNKGYMDIFVDGTCVESIDMSKMDVNGHFKYKLSGKECRVDVYLPRDGLKIKNFTASGDVKAVKGRTKALFYGDSITYGYIIDRVSDTYVSVLSRIMDYEFVNFGVGGTTFDGGQVIKPNGYVPDVIFVAYGANAGSVERVEPTMTAFMDNLKKLYPQQKIYVLTPLWTNDVSKTGYINGARDKIAELASKYENVTVIDGLTLLPGDTSYFNDGLHPNGKGNFHMGYNVGLAIDKSRFVDVTNMGNFDKNSGIFTFDNYSAKIKNNEAYAYTGDKVISLDGINALYINSKFYVPQLLIDILEGNAVAKECTAISPIECEIATSLTESGWKIYAEIGNMLLEKTISGKLNFTKSAIQNNDIAIGLKPGEKTKIEIDCPSIGNYMPEDVFEYNITTDDGEVYNYSSVYRGSVVAGYTDKKITIDGIIDDEWKNCTKYIPTKIVKNGDWQKKGDLSVEFSVMWDKDNFYLYAVTEDNVFLTSDSESLFWQADSIQFGVYSDREKKLIAGDAGAKFEEIGLVYLNGETPVAYRSMSQTGSTWTGVLKNAEIACVKNDNTVTYELKISWIDLFGYKYPAKNGALLGFSMLVNDNDGNGRKGWIEFGSGLGVYKAVDEFCFLYLNAQKNASDVTVLYNGEKIEFDVQPIIIDGRTMVPVRAIFEKIGATVTWEPDTQTVCSVLDNKTVSLQINSTSMTVNNTKTELDVPAQIVNDRTLVPLRAISEAYNCDVQWDQNTRTVTVTR